MTGTSQAVEEEFRGILTKMKSKQGEAIKSNVKEMAKALRIERDGRAKEVIRDFADA